MFPRILFCLSLCAAVLAAPAFAEEPLEQLQGQLEQVLEDRAMRSFRSAIRVVDVDTGEVVFERGANRALIPASTMKAITAAAALHELGPAWRFETRLESSATLDSDGTLAGDLVVRGGGDPSLVVEKLWKMVLDLRLAGVERIEGDVVYDDSRFDDGPFLSGWDKPEDLERGVPYFAAVGALSVNFNTVALVVRPGLEAGESGRVVLETPAEGYASIGADALQTVASEQGTRIRVTRTIEEDGRVSFAVSGRIAEDKAAVRLYRTVADPTAHFMAVFRGLLEREGIEVIGEHRRASVPSAEALVALRSSPLPVVLMDMNKFSNNFMAEQVWRTLGAETSGVGNNDTGRKAVTAYLEGLGLDPRSFELVNGSGLSRDIRLRPEHLTTVLSAMAGDGRVDAEFRASLAIAGLDGTLWKRLTDEPGRVRGKTGTVDGVHCLAGYIDGADGQRYAFAFLANDIRGGSRKVKGIHDRLARQIFTHTEVERETSAP